MVFNQGGVAKGDRSRALVGSSVVGNADDLWRSRRPHVGTGVNASDRYGDVHTDGDGYAHSDGNANQNSYSHRYPNAHGDTGTIGLGDLGADVGGVLPSELASYLDLGISRDERLH